MGFAIWFFVRNGEGDFRPTALRTMEDFFHGRRGLPEASAGGFIEFAEVHVGLSGRRAKEVFRVGNFKYRVDARGMMDQAEWHRRMRLASEMAGGRLPELDRSAGVLNASHKFAAREFDHIGRWKPSESDVAALRSAVNRRAKRELL